jgi:hypothetical protein
VSDRSSLCIHTGVAQKTKSGEWLAPERIEAAILSACAGWLTHACVSVIDLSVVLVAVARDHTTRDMSHDDALRRLHQQCATRYVLVLFINRVTSFVSLRAYERPKVMCWADEIEWTCNNGYVCVGIFSFDKSGDNRFVTSSNKLKRSVVTLKYCDRLRALLAAVASTTGDVKAVVSLDATEIVRELAATALRLNVTTIDMNMSLTDQGADRCAC